ncbi:MAG TPA: winged helix-turn-helix transcriptional regulator [Opitutaceae bacterium]|nr:winged helix-turn-helix transcriptional regulator [Opitutaceae bacterium]
MPSSHRFGAAAITVNILKRKWSVVILRHLNNGVCSPAAICDAEPDLSPMALNERLRMMFRYNLITHNPFRVSAKTQECHLTPRGSQILKMINLIEQIDEMDETGDASMERPVRESAAPVSSESSTSSAGTTSRNFRPSQPAPDPEQSKSSR